MNTNEFENLMGSLEAGNSGYMCFDRKEDMLFLEARTGRECLLVDKRDKLVVELVDKDGRMVAFTPEDVVTGFSCMSLRMAGRKLNGLYARTEISLPTGAASVLKTARN